MKYIRRKCCLVQCHATYNAVKSLNTNRYQSIWMKKETKKQANVKQTLPSLAALRDFCLSSSAAWTFRGLLGGLADVWGGHGKLFSVYMKHGVIRTQSFQMTDLVCCSGDVHHADSWWLLCVSICRVLKALSLSVNHRNRHGRNLTLHRWTLSNYDFWNSSI